MASADSADGAFARNRVLVPPLQPPLNPMGTITKEAFETLVARMLERLASDGPWDVVLLALHGAAVAEQDDDQGGGRGRAGLPDGV
ncbi:microcystin degradation protein MlrC, partial [bacterium]|nr:microcystin degradation protein MlrC [bacterium]